MKLVLYKPLVRPEFKRNSWYYLGFGYLKAYLQEHNPGIEVEVVYEAQDIRSARPDVIGISTVTEMWPRVLALHDDIRGWFDGPVLFGGPHITALPQLLPRGRNLAFIGEGEHALSAVMQRLQRGTDIFSDLVPGTACQDREQLVVGPPTRLLDINTLPPPADTPPDRFLLTTVRGCPYHCTHCVEHAIQGRPRQMSAERLAELVIDRHERFGTTVFEMLDDLFLVSSKRLAAFVDLLDRRGLLDKLEFHRLSLMANLITEEVAATLGRMRLKQTGMGVESADPEILRRFKAGIVTREHIERAIDLCARRGVNIGGSTVLGYPGETEPQLRNTIEFFADHVRQATFSFWGLFVCQPLPGSVLWHNALRDGRVSLDMDFSRLRIDADVRHFDSEWYYDNDAALPRDRFLQVLREYDLIRNGHFLKDATVLGKPRTQVFGRQYASPELAQRRTLEKLAGWRLQDGRPIAVFGAGEHTRKILPALRESPVEVACILDDDPERIGSRIESWDVLSPSSAGQQQIGAILVSSDRWQEQIAERLQPLAAGRFEILKLYESGELA